MNMKIRNSFIISVLALATLMLGSAGAQNLSVDALIAASTSPWTQTDQTREAAPAAQSMHNMTVELTVSDASDPISTVQFYLSCENSNVKIEDVMPTSITGDIDSWHFAASVDQELTNDGKHQNIVRCVIYRVDTDSDAASEKLRSLLHLGCVSSQGSAILPEEFKILNAYAITASGKRIALESGKQIEVRTKMDVRPTPERNNASSLITAEYDVLNLLAELSLR